MGDKAAKALELFNAGANCSQSVLMAFADECGMDERAACRLASGFGGGVGRMRQVCGAVSAMVIVANIKYGPDAFGDKSLKDAQYAIVQELAAKFKAEAGSIVCAELLGGGNASTAPVSNERTADFYRKRPCARLVALAAGIMEDYLEKHPC